MRPAVRALAAATAALITVGGLLPTAQAAEQPGAVEQARATLAEHGVATAPLDPVVEAAVDGAVADAQAAGEQARGAIDDAAAGAVAGISDAAADAGFTGVPAPGVAYERVPDPYGEGPNYHWSNDPLDQMLAGKLPGSGPVLHRAPGSYFDAAPVPPEVVSAAERGHALMGAGTPIYVGDDSMCTLTAVGTDAQGRKVGLTAGHCGEVGEPVYSADALGVGAAGTVVAKDPEYDYAVVELGSNTELTDNYGGVKVNGVGTMNAGLGTQLCKQGVATGYTCGMTWLAQPGFAITQVCAGAGDSGAPVLQDGRVVGAVTGGMLPFYEISCRTPLQGPLFMPTLVSPIAPAVDSLNRTDASRPGSGFTAYRR